MGIQAVLILAVALAMDAFAVAVATGVALVHVNGRQTFRMAWHFGLFQAVMPILGWGLGQSVASLIEAFDHYLAFGLLGFVGLKMIKEAFGGGGEKVKNDPTRGMSLVMLSVATSIDALAVGLSMSLLGVSVWFPALIIGLVAAAFTATGLHLGRLAGRAALLSRFAEALGGLVLIGIGVKILHEHGALGLLF